MFPMTFQKVFQVHENQGVTFQMVPPKDGLALSVLIRTYEKFELKFMVKAKGGFLKEF